MSPTHESKSTPPSSKGSPSLNNDNEVSRILEPLWSQMRISTETLMRQNSWSSTRTPSMIYSSQTTSNSRPCFCSVQEQYRQNRPLSGVSDPMCEITWSGTRCASAPPEQSFHPSGRPYSVSFDIGILEHSSTQASAPSLQRLLSADSAISDGTDIYRDTPKYDDDVFVAPTSTEDLTRDMFLPRFASMKSLAEPCCSKGILAAVLISGLLVVIFIGILMICFL